MTNQVGKLIGIYSSDQSGAGKTAVAAGELLVGHGLRGDSHAGLEPHRQISLFAAEIVRELAAAGFSVSAGELSANLFTADIQLDSLAVGARLRVGEAVIELSEARKPCRSITRIDHRLPKLLLGKCGWFGRIVTGGTVRAGDEIALLDDKLPRP